MKEPLEYLDRKALQLQIMRNIERAVMNLHGNNELHRFWKTSRNWLKVQMFLNACSSKAGSTSSTQQCMFLGVEPDGKSFYDMLEGVDNE